MNMPETVLEARDINKYFSDPVKFQVLNKVSMSVNSGEFVSIIGKSGCGKSTLLYILSTMDTDYDGEIWLDNEKLTGQTRLKLANIRNEKIGFVFQFHYLLDEFNVLKNVMLPGLKLGKKSKEEVESDALAHLRSLDIAEQALKRPSQLSGGQKQRIAIARALINNPLIIMGDEPTGNLDKRNTEIVFDIFKQLTSEQKQTILVVTHDTDFAGRSDRIIEMADGTILTHSLKG